MQKAKSRRKAVMDAVENARSVRMRAWREMRKFFYKPDYVASKETDSHSSRTQLALRLKPSTRSQKPGRLHAAAYLMLLPVEIARFTRP